MRTLEDELRALCPLDWQPSSMRPSGFTVFIAGMARRGLVTVQGARAGAVLVVRAEVASTSLRYYLACASDSRGAELVTSGPDLAAELQRAAQMDAGIRAGLVAKSSRVEHIARLLTHHGATITYTAMDDMPNRYAVSIQVVGVDRDFVQMMAAAVERDDGENKP